MTKQFWFGMAAAAGLLMGGSAMAQQQPTIFGKPVQTAPQAQPQQQGTKPGPVIFGKQTRIPANTPQTGSQTRTYPRVHRRDRDHDRDWSRYRRTHPQNTPAGWRKGNKTGWGDCDVPPGQAKKIGCRPGRDWRERDRDHDHDKGHGHRK